MGTDPCFICEQDAWAGYPIVLGVDGVVMLARICEICEGEYGPSEMIDGVRHSPNAVSIIMSRETCS